MNHPFFHRCLLLGLLMSPTLILAGSLNDSATLGTSDNTTRVKRTTVINHHQQINDLCHDIGQKLSSVRKNDCTVQELVSNGGTSVQGYPLAYKEYPPIGDKTPLGKVLLMGGIHGDEYAAISIMFKWMDKLNQYHSGLFHWKVVPTLNPDGLLQNKSQRQNSRGVDLNRNFPSKNWDDLAVKYWKERTYSNPRRYPGPYALSEPETIWFTQLIQEFSPDVIIAVHAPHRLVDFDGTLKAPSRLGSLHLSLLGTYPGSLGNYAGVDLNIPVVTVELASAGIMPSEQEISLMWVDIVKWLRKEIPQKQ
jgi:murein peptide amidase A